MRFATPHVGAVTFRSAKGRAAMSIVAWIVLGLIAGFIGSKLVNKAGDEEFGPPMVTAEELGERTAAGAPASSSI